MLSSSCLVLWILSMCQKVILLCFFSSVDGILCNKQKRYGGNCDKPQHETTVNISQ